MRYGIGRQSDTFFWAVLGVFLLGLLILAGYSAERESHCVRWENTGGLTCWGSDSWKQCDPTRVCVAYDDEVP